MEGRAGGQAIGLTARPTRGATIAHWPARRRPHRLRDVRASDRHRRQHRRDVEPRAAGDLRMAGIAVAGDSDLRHRGHSGAASERSDAADGRPRRSGLCEPRDPAVDSDACSRLHRSAGTDRTYSTLGECLGQGLRTPYAGGRGRQSTRPQPTPGRRGAAAAATSRKRRRRWSDRLGSRSRRCDALYDRFIERTC